MGHEYAIDNRIYQFVSDEFRSSTLSNALDRTVEGSLARTSEEGTS